MFKEVTQARTAPMKVLTAPQVVSFVPSHVHIYVIAVRTDIPDAKIEPVRINSRRVPEIGETVSARNRWYGLNSEEEFIYEG